MTLHPLGYQTPLDSTADLRRATRPHDTHETRHRRDLLGRRRLRRDT